MRSSAVLVAAVVSLLLLANAPAFAEAPACDASQGRVEGAVAWTDQTEADWIYAVSTRFSDVDGHRVHYPTPTAELAAALAARPEPDALRHLADARLALGDRAAAIDAIRRWGEARGAYAWLDVAGWAERNRELGLAFEAAARALPCLDPASQARLADRRVRWADSHPELADPIAMRAERAALFPRDGRALESWIRALETAKRFDEADKAMVAETALTPERRLIVRADLAVDHHDDAHAFEVLDGAVETAGWSDKFRRAYVEKTKKAHSELPDAWRTTLDDHFDRAALIRLATYFEGAGRGPDAADLLRQVERRNETTLDRDGWLTLARFYGEIDAVPEAFRARLSAARLATGEHAGDAQLDDLATLVRLALAAGSRPLALGSYNDESYRWVARIDRTPGFWTGGVSLLLTGGDWKEALANLEGQSLAERTFATARALADELARRAPTHAELPALRVALMERYVDRGDGKAALALLKEIEPTAPPAVADDARRVALLAMRQTQVPVAEEARLYRDRLRALAPDGSRPELGDPDDSYEVDSELLPPEDRDQVENESDVEIATWGRPSMNPQPESYKKLLDEALARLDDRDKSHKATTELMLGELDRMPDAEALWLELAKRLETQNLDDDLGPRYEKALERFRGPTWFARMARWYAKRTRYAEMRKLAQELVGRFRSAGIFERVDWASTGGLPALEIPEQPKWGTRVRLVAWADWVRLEALERFPHSPRVVSEAVSRLRRASDTTPEPSPTATSHAATVVPDALLDERSWALLFVDPSRRAAWIDTRMSRGELATSLAAIEARTDRTPVDEALLADGWARLSHFEKAAGPADRVAAAYPSDSTAVHTALSLHRSLAALEPGHPDAARKLVERSAKATPTANTLFTELGEMEEERGRPSAASLIWLQILELDPRDPKRIDELATLFWDYEHMEEALHVIEDGRKRLGRPHLLAFEAGALREELRDLDGAVHEYLAALDMRDEEMAERWPYTTDSDERALRRLGTLLGRARPRAAVLTRIRALEPGKEKDQEELVTLLSLLELSPPTESAEDRAFLDWLIDRDDLPHDPVARAEREAAREARRPAERAGVVEVGDALLSKSLAMVSAATSSEFLDTVGRWQPRLTDERWVAGRTVALGDALAARRGDLATGDVERVNREIERATALVEQRELERAAKVWDALLPRIEKLPEGGAKIRAYVAHADYVEKTGGTAAASAAWARTAERFPWSLGVLEDRLAFLTRIDDVDGERAALRDAADRAAAGHREALLERLAHECLDPEARKSGDAAAHASDLEQARRAALALVTTTYDGFDDNRRLTAFATLARASFLGQPATDGLALVHEHASRFPAERLPDLYAVAARAADEAGADASGVTLWIEALNRRTERDWIGEAARTAERGGESARLLAFFQQQHERSPRDVRWAVVVRELDLANGDLEGAITVAKAAVQVRPEKSELWTEAADLLARAGRPQEAADYLGGLDKLAAGNEEIVRLRGGFYARAANLTGTPAAVATAGDKIAAIERDGIDAFKKQRPLDDDRRAELGRRQSRAVRRLNELGYAPLGWRFLAGPNDQLAAVFGSQLSPGEQAELALRAGKLARMLVDARADESFRSAAADVVAARATAEQKDEILALVLGKSAAIVNGQLDPASSAAIAKGWDFARTAGLEDALRLALARKLAAATPGPWQPSGTGEVGFSFLQGLAQGIATKGSGPARIELPRLEQLWVQDLVNRDRPEELVEYLAPRVRAWMARVLTAGASPTGPAPSGTSPSGDVQPDWIGWLSAENVFDTWCRGLAARPELAKELGDAFTDTDRWNRFLALGARHWNTGRLARVFSDDVRYAWFRANGDLGTGWETASDARALPADTRAKVSSALGQLVTGVAGATANEVFDNLRGPRTVGDALGRDPRWSWFGAAPATERPDAVRFPRDLWGDRPGEAWYALEALYRIRKGDPSAARVPLEVSDRGDQSERERVAARIAERIEGPAAALAVDAAHRPVRVEAQDLDWRVRVLAAAGRKPDADALVAGEVRRQQTKIGADELRNLRRTAKSLGLGDPLAALDPATKVAPAALAYLADVSGVAAARSFQPTDAVDFRTALTERWRDRDGELPADATAFWLDELWARGSAHLPQAGLAKAGGWLAAAADWLGGRKESDRAAALAAVRALPGDTAPFLALVPKDPRQRDEATRLLWARVLLARHETAPALDLLGAVLADARNGTSAPSPTSAPAVASSVEDGESDEESGEESAAMNARSPEGDEEEGDFSPGPPPEANGSEDSTVARIRRWLAVFQDARKAGDADLVADAEARTAETLRFLDGHDRATAASWVLALELAHDGDARGRVLAALEAAWIRGALRGPELEPLVESLARLAPDAAPAWLARWPVAFAASDVIPRAQVLARLGDRAAAERLFLGGRVRGNWTAPDEVRAFDAWRNLPKAPDCDRKTAACPPAPASAAPTPWIAAAAFWREPAQKVGADLTRQLSTHPFDLLAARAALRTVAPAPADAMARAAVTLRDRTMQSFDDAGTDANLLRLRAMRGLLPTSWRAADSVMEYEDPSRLTRDLTRRKMRRADIDGALGDLARLHAAAGDGTAAEVATRLLEDRGAANAAKVRADVEASLKPVPPPSYRMSNGQPRPYRPRDLDWSLVRSIVAAEGTR